MSKREMAEGIFTILAIAALWPVVLGWEHPIYRVILAVVLVILVILTVNKFRRIKRLYDEKRPEARKRP